MPGDILPNRHTPGFINGRRIYWLLTIEYGSDIIRLSTDDHDIDEAVTGKQHHYDGRLDEIRFSERIDFLQDVSEGVSVPVEVVMPISIADRESKGHRLEGSIVELARWVKGTDFNERRRIARGEVSDPEWGADDEPVSFSVESVVWRDDVLIPFEGLRVLSKNWSTIDTIDPAERGVAYPIVFGTPGKVSTDLYSRGWITGSQGCWVDRTSNIVISGGASVGTEGLRVVLAGHPVMATRVYLSLDAYVAGERFVVLQGIDNKGNLVSYVDAAVIHTSSPGSGDFIVGDPDGADSYGLGSHGPDSAFRPNAYPGDAGVKPIFCGWYNDSQDVDGGEGGMQGKDGTLVREAGDVLEVLLGYTSKPIDRGRFAAAKTHLSPFKIDAVIDAQCKPWEWIRQHLLPILPISIVTGPEGLYPVVWRFDATSHDAVVHLNTEEDPRIRRAGRVITDSSELKNSFTLDYAESVRTGGYFGTTRLTAGPYDVDDPTTLVSLHCRISQHRYRYADGSPRIVEEKLESVVIYDTATANAVLNWRARAYALARKYIDYLVPEEDYGWLERGAVVTMTDPELRIDGWVCLVVDAQTDDSGLVGIRLLRVEDPARDGHSI